MTEPGSWMAVTGTEFASTSPEDRLEILMMALLELATCELLMRLHGQLPAAVLYSAGGWSRIGPGGRLEVRQVPL